VRSGPFLLGLVGAVALGGAVQTAVAGPAAGTGTPTTVTGAMPSATGARSTASRSVASSAKALVTSAVAAAKAQKSVHFVEWASAGKQSVSVIGDVSPTTGQQTITVRDGSSVGHVEGLFAEGQVYFRGDAYGLGSYLGMPTALARKYVNRWIAFSKSDSGFAQTAKQFTVAGPLSEIDLTGKLSRLTTTTIDATPVMVVKGRTNALSSKGRSGSGTLYVTSDGTRLPVRFTGTGRETAGSSTGRVDFSRWGEPVNVKPPAGAIPASKVA